VRDSIIAATALANNLEVVTENTSDFIGVETINPLKD
jgi:predicted nucleic acid-binding protein